MKKSLLFMLLFALIGFGCSDGDANSDSESDMSSNTNAQNKESCEAISNTELVFFATGIEDTGTFRKVHEFIQSTEDWQRFIASEEYEISTKYLNDANKEEINKKLALVDFNTQIVLYAREEGTPSSSRLRIIKACDHEIMISSDKCEDGGTSDSGQQFILVTLPKDEYHVSFPTDRTIICGRDFEY